MARDQVALHWLWRFGGRMLFEYNLIGPSVMFQCFVMLVLCRALCDFSSYPCYDYQGRYHTTDDRPNRIGTG